MPFFYRIGLAFIRVHSRLRIQTLWREIFRSEEDFLNRVFRNNIAQAATGFDSEFREV